MWLRTRNPRKRYNQGTVSDVLCLVLFRGGLGCCCVLGIPVRDIKPGSCFRCAVFDAVPGRVGRGCVPGIPGRDIKPVSCFRCAVFGAVPDVPGRVGRGCIPGILGRDIKPGSCFRCAVFGAVSGVPGWVGRGCVQGIPGRDKITVLFQMCCVCCCSWVDWGVVAYQESQEEI